ncbi:DnaJ domain-containing protein [Xylariaceae sp. FL1651]|nr:DnaJ domain-containing protein [Xylariaceae sp. FL1651]
MSSPILGYYAVLELTKDATTQDISKAYRRLARLHHPDKNKGNEQAATAKFQQIQIAYETLNDFAKRQAYDSSYRPTSTYRPRTARATRSSNQQEYTQISPTAGNSQYYRPAASERSQQSQQPHQQDWADYAGVAPGQTNSNDNGGALQENLWDPAPNRPYSEYWTQFDTQSHDGWYW